MSYIHPFFEDSMFAGFVHRGGAEESTENTLEAFQYSANMGFTYMETDVQASCDGEIVVFHDSDLKRMVGINKRIIDLTYKEIRKIRLDEKFQIPSLNDLLSSFKELKFNIDIKTNEAVEKTIQIISSHKAFGRVCLASFSSRRLDKVRKLVDDKYCTSMGMREVFKAKIGSLGLPLHHPKGACAQVPKSQWGIPLVTKKFIDYLQGKDKFIHVWTIDEEEEMDQLISLGVNGIMTDRPKVLKKVMEKHGLM